MKGIAAALALMLATHSASAQDSLMLEEKCTSGNLDDLAVCLSWFNSALEQYWVWTGLGYTNQQLPHCFPERGISSAVTSRVWTKWIEENPEKLAVRVGLSYTAAMKDAFPCD